MCQLDYAQFASARNNFERAMVADPAYAPAYSYSSIWHMRRVAQEWSPDVKRDMELAAQLAERAMQIDPDDAFALAVYGYAKSFVEKQHAIGLQYLDLATTRYPNQPYAWIYKAAVLSFVNEADEAVRCAEVGLKLSPRDQFMWFAEAVCGQAYYSKGDMMKAVDLARRANAGAPRHRGNLRVLIAALVSLGQISEARTIARSVKFDLSAWAARTPLPEPLLTATVRRLHIAGLDAPAVA
jgi:tetratricopeptide (TPR) repeat protein